MSNSEFIHEAMSYLIGLLTYSLSWSSTSPIFPVNGTPLEKFSIWIVVHISQALVENCLFLRPPSPSEKTNNQASNPNPVPWILIKIKPIREKWLILEGKSTP